MLGKVWPALRMTWSLRSLWMASGKAWASRAIPLCCNLATIFLKTWSKLHWREVWLDYSYDWLNKCSMDLAGRRDKQYLSKILSFYYLWQMKLSLSIIIILITINPSVLVRQLSKKDLKFLFAFCLKPLKAAWNHVFSRFYILHLQNTNYLYVN